MHFGNEHLLAALLVVPVVLWLYLYAFRRKWRLLQRFAHVAVIERLIQSTNFKAQYRKTALVLFALCLIIFALARPQYGSIERPLVRKGVDIFIAIDTSTSMLAQDMKPSRLARAQEQLRNFIRRLKGDRVGIIVFAGYAFMQCPLTLDYGLALRVVDSIDVNSVPVQGTAIGAAIRASIDAFKRTEKGYRVLVLLTDGEDQGTEPIEAAKKAAEEGVRIYAIGIGSPSGSPIPLADGGFKEDKEGSKVMSRLDFETLQKLALATGGKAVIANPSGDLELDEVYKDIDAMKKKELESKMFTIYEDRFQYFLLPAILMLMFEAVMSERKKRL